MRKFEGHVARNSDELKNLTYLSHSVSALNISTITSLDDIKDFNLLRYLNIYTMNALELYEDCLVDTSNLSRLKSLRSLVLENDDHIRELKVYGLKNLHRLSITSCHNLRKIGGLKSLTNLRELIIYDTPNIDLDFLNRVVEFINSNQNLTRIILDINFFNFFDERQLEILRSNNVMFAEKLGIKDNYIFTFKMMEEFNRRVLEIYRQIHERCKNSDDILYAIYEYVRSIDYDDESLLNRQKYLENGGIIYRYSNRYKSINSSYSALLKNKAVCEGYVNLLKYFYNLEGVDLYPVICDYKNSSHVAAKALIGGVELYFDPELDHRFNNHNDYGISKDEFLRNHDILFYRDNFDHLSDNPTRKRDE